MTRQFAEILQGLMENRRLTPRAVSRASGRAESTIQQLLSGKVLPSVEIVQDISPVLEISAADLQVIAGLPDEPPRDHPAPYRAANEIGQLVAVASWLTPEKVADLVEVARSYRSEGIE
ncbi:helix-turn-helix domain-containing protein [Streptomyces sp. NBC_00259]|uniref:helix-turn-helix domain-containing protein n=1 Tax=Streptomyces sp. NBC_00259 TaxID=2903643 RepID=UPI002E2C2798|nr:helix-turn-helix transcriptional regulator [Streptomyces sp. NBC_00259]